MFWALNRYHLLKMHVTLGSLLARMAVYSQKSLDVGKMALAAYCTGATSPSLISAKPPLIGANLLTTSYFIHHHQSTSTLTADDVNLCDKDMMQPRNKSRYFLRSSFAFPQLFTFQVLLGGEEGEVTRLNHHQRRPKKWIIPLFLPPRILLIPHNSFIMSDKNHCHCCPSFSSGKIKS